MEIQKATVFPVLDCACAITLWPAWKYSQYSIPVMKKVAVTCNHRLDSTLLDSRGTLQAICIDSAEKITLKGYVIETLGGLIDVGLDLSYVSGI